MSLHDDLLEQARLLATLDTRRPKQANLRRAVSASYYALFHLLVDAASASYVSDFNLKARVARTFNHGEMKKVSMEFVNNRLPKALQAPRYITPVDLRTWLTLLSTCNKLGTKPIMTRWAHSAVNKQWISSNKRPTHLPLGKK